MSKCRTMYAGSSGSVTGRTNNFSLGNGNGKWQGLPNTTNMPSPLINKTNARARGNDRNVIFCMNQLGGNVGKISTMHTASKAGPSCEYDYLFGKAAFLIIRELKKYFNTTKKGATTGRSLVLVGSHETLTSDGVYTLSTLSGGDIDHLYAGQLLFDTLPANIKHKINQINNLNIRVPLKDGGVPQLHVLGLIDITDQQKLVDNDYGLFTYFGPSEALVTYGFGSCIKDAAKAALEEYGISIVKQDTCKALVEAGIIVLPTTEGGADPAGDAVEVGDAAGAGFCIEGSGGAPKFTLTQKILIFAAKAAYECGKQSVEKHKGFFKKILHHNFHLKHFF